MLNNLSDTISLKIDTMMEELYTYLKNNMYLIALLAIAALAAYGFELFNLNLSIDAEIFAASPGPLTGWISQGRWGMYLLNRFLLPHAVIPFVPLFLALVFHMGAILLLLHCWEVKSRLERVVIGSVCMAFPTMAYTYTFVQINYGIGIGLFCIALSLFIYSRRIGAQKFFAVVPAAFAVSIYQGLIAPLIAVFLVYIITRLIRTGQAQLKDWMTISCIIILAALVYYIIEKLIFLVSTVRPNGYVDQFFEPAFLLNHFGFVLATLLSFLLQVYGGSKSIYAIDMPVLLMLISVSLFCLAANVSRSKMSTLNKMLVGFFSLALLLLPFAGGLIMRGYVAGRCLLALPIVISALVMLAMHNNPRFLKMAVALLVVFCVFQFTVSTNRLFASSHIALQADRLLASRLIERIDAANAEADTKEKLNYMEIVGYLDRPETELIPKIETFGASFFEFGQGNIYRILLFMKTIGYEGLHPLPLDRRIQMIGLANSMPVWPAKGSVLVVDDTVLIKFGPYSNEQKEDICKSIKKQAASRYLDFCK